MLELDFEWDAAKAGANRRKHGIPFPRAATVFRDPSALTIPDEEHSDAEPRWVTLGLADNGVLTVVIHTYEDTGTDTAVVRIISARQATRSEQRQYDSAK